jgi:hypothetical protein
MIANSFLLRFQERVVVDFLAARGKASSRFPKRITGCSKSLSPINGGTQTLTEVKPEAADVDGVCSSFSVLPR